jgi:signal transduction histidine kinase
MRRPRAGYQEGPLRIVGSDVPVESGYMLRPLAGGDWLLSGRSFGERLSLQRTLERSLLLALGASVLLGLLCGAVTAHYVSRRVGAIATVADDVTRGEMGRRVLLSGADDAFDTLGRQINHMLDRIEALMEELRLLTDSLAHDLRSPVGRLRARIDAALSAPTEERRQQLLSGVLNEADSLMRILTTVLEIGRSEAMTSRKQFAWLGPDELVAELADMYEPLAEESGAALSTEVRGVLLPLFGHRQLLAQALSNLVDNALKYAASGREIVLLAEQDDGEIRLGVSDRGPGIAPADEAEARRRFGRLDASRSSGGAGLGLALAQAVAHLHHGRLELQDNRPGLRAFLVIPAAVAA